MSVQTVVDDLSSSRTSVPVQVLPLIQDAADTTVNSSLSTSAQPYSARHSCRPTSSTDIVHKLSPPPKSEKMRARKCKIENAAVLTSSPYKKSLVERQNKKRP